MRLQTILGAAALSLLLPAALLAKPYNELEIFKLDGTIMVQHPGNAKPTALETGSTVEKGDILTVYDQSWAILRDHKGDLIGLDAGTVMVVDEFYIEGPDRQVRFILQKGTLFLKTNNCGSRQSFFEINAGSVVTSIGDLHGILTYDPKNNEHLRVEYMEGKINVIDKDREEKFQLMESHFDSSTKEMKEVGTPDRNEEHNWENGAMLEKPESPVPMEEIDGINYRRFFEGEKRLVPRDNNLLLPGAD
jgi:hypothetical protein